MNLRFREAKTTQAAARLLKLRGGNMGYMKLIKLLYLVDRTALLRWGRPVTGDRYVSMDRGPVLSQTYNLIIDEPCPGEDTTWARHISKPQNYEVKLAKDTSGDELSEAENGLIEEIFGQFGGMNRWDLVEFVHKLPEWQNPEGSAVPISYRDILLAGGKTEAETAAILQEIDGLAMADALLPAR
ncbi:MAG: Panacea domain-containing protein [Lacunisphaera sp.]